MESGTHFGRVKNNKPSKDMIKENLRAVLKEYSGWLAEVNTCWGYDVEPYTGRLRPGELYVLVDMKHGWGVVFAAKKERSITDVVAEVARLGALGTYAVGRVVCVNKKFQLPTEIKISWDKIEEYVFKTLDENMKKVFNYISSLNTCVSANLRQIEDSNALGIPGRFYVAYGAVVKMADGAVAARTFALVYRHEPGNGEKIHEAVLNVLRGSLEFDQVFYYVYELTC